MVTNNIILEMLWKHWPMLWKHWPMLKSINNFPKVVRNFLKRRKMAAVNPLAIAISDNKIIPSTTVAVVTRV